MRAPVSIRMNGDDCNDEVFQCARSGGAAARASWAAPALAGMLIGALLAGCSLVPFAVALAAATPGPRRSEYGTIGLARV